AQLPGVSVFHAGTKLEGDKLVANGGRVLTICATAPTAAKARSRAYEAAATIQWADKMLRSDIGL
ncbi:MAG: phosphoribosylamine--glycine ligase, partial [Bifidobacteriales bacterium]|nr:phosphoribosylamine--glycine ligase [Bifidobacteriales bacterium]